MSSPKLTLCKNSPACYNFIMRWIMKRKVLTLLVIGALIIVYFAFRRRASLERNSSSENVITDIAGQWQDDSGQHVYLSITGSPETIYDIAVNHTLSAARFEVWNLSGVWDAKSKQMTYQDASKRRVTKNVEGDDDSSTIFTNGKGYFALDGNRLRWHDNQREANEKYLEELSFIRLESQ